MGNLNFNAENVAPRTAYDPLPPGWYSVRITGAEMKASEKAGDMLKLEHEIDGNAHPQFAGRKVWSNLCLNHPNQEPREIAQRSLSALLHAIGKLQIQDSDELLGAGVLVKLVAQPAKDGFDARNEVRGYKSAAEGTTFAAKPAAAPAAAAASSAPAKAQPWKR